MPLFTVKPAIVQKNVAAVYTIDYADLASYAAVPDGYYSNPDNWKEVFIKMRHKHSNQRGTLHFQKPGDTAELLLSDTARGGDWQIEGILIRDYDRGEVVLQRPQIPSAGDYDFISQSSATHGDLWVGPSQTVQIPSGGKLQYGDFVVEAGGTIQLADGGGITEVEVLGNCIINGTIEATNGTHTGGTWNSTSVLSEPLSHGIAQKTGGKGGVGEANPQTIDIGDSNDSVGWFLNLPNQLEVTGVVGAAPQPSVQNGDRVRFYTSAALTTETGTPRLITDSRANDGGSSTQIDLDGNAATAFFKVERDLANPGGDGGFNGAGNGGGGGRSDRFGALVGGNASAGVAGLGAGQNDAAPTAYGEDGAPSLTSSEAGNGGFRGKHGQAFYLKAKRIQGNGTIDARGEKGGDGGDGAEYLDGGLLWGNGGGGGAAGGDGGKIWLRHQDGTPALSLLVSGGAQGNRGAGGFGATEAEHGTAGSAGTTDTTTW